MTLNTASLHDQLFSRYKIVENRTKNWKYSGWRQNDIEHVTVQSVIYTLSTYANTKPKF